MTVMQDTRRSTSRPPAKTPRRIVILGPQGSGKGTQAELLAKRLRVPAVSMGQLLRDEKARGTALGRTIARRVDRGQYVPSSIAIRVLERWFARGRATRGFVLDGYPRKLAQLRHLDRLTSIDAAVVIELSDRECIARLAGRRIGPDGRVYHLRFQPPPTSVPPSSLQLRHDDTPAEVRKRLREHHRYTDPVIRAYDQRGLVHRFSGRPSIAVIARQIAARLLG